MRVVASWLILDRRPISTKAMASVMLSILIVSILIATLVKSEDEIIRHTTSGDVQGLRKRVLDRDVDVFLGIPYATPPVGDRRFRPPDLVAPWDGIKDARTLPPACYQENDEFFGDFEGTKMWNSNTGVSEDCLYLNIWQPLGGEPGKATMIWIYGGAFYSGSSALELYDGAYLAAKGDVIVVSMQYRLGPFGFLHLGGGSSGDAALGNMGLMDQNVAIEWFKNNAEQFGGDKERITLFGESAGSASVSYHLLSSFSQPLFRSAIMQSASALAPWAYDEPEIAHSKTLQLGRLVNCSVDTKEEKLTDEQRSDLVKCLQKVPAKSLSTEQFSIKDYGTFIIVSFVPTIDGNFIEKSPHELMSEKDRLKKPILTGVVKNEGSYFLAYLQPSRFPFKEDPPAINWEQYRQGAREIFKCNHKYVDDVIAVEKTVLSLGMRSYRDLLDDMLGEAAFKCPVYQQASHYSKAGNDVYLYEFDHRTSANPWPKYLGVMHGYEIDHAFGLPLDQSLNYEFEEKVLSEQVVKYWTNFAKSGNPNLGDDGKKNVEVEWPVYNAWWNKVLSLNTPYVSIKRGLSETTCSILSSVSGKCESSSEN